jgi:Ser/Thr protein kinase RdoA (MazF antagonist)
MKIHSAHPFDSRSAEARAEHEFLVLTDLGSMTGLQDPATRGFTYGVPRVLARAGRALLLEACNGRLLVDRIRRARLGGRRDRAALVDAVERTGTWLRVFQQHTKREGDAQEILDALTWQARRDLEVCRVVPPARAGINKRLESLATLAAKSVSAGMPAVGHHGDLWPGNIFVADRRLTVIDFEGFRQGLPCEDVAYFLVQLELFFAHLPFVRFWRQLRDAFLRGYQGTVEVDREVYDFCRLVKALQILASHTRADRRSGSHAQRRDHVLRRIAARG